MNLVIIAPVDPSKFATIRVLHSLFKGLLRWALFQHFYETQKLTINLVQICICYLLMSHGFPKHCGQIKCQMTSCSKTATHQSTNKLKQAEVVATVRFRVYYPFGFEFSSLIAVVW